MKKPLLILEWLGFLVVVCSGYVGGFLVQITIGAYIYEKKQDLIGYFFLYFNTLV